MGADPCREEPLRWRSRSHWRGDCIGRLKLTRPISVVSAVATKRDNGLMRVNFTMKRHLRVLLIIGLLAGGFAFCSPTAEAGLFGRGGLFRGYRSYGYGPGWGYSVYRPYGYGMGGFGLGYRGYGGYGYGYPAFGSSYGYGYPYYSGYGLGYSGYGYGINNPAFGIYSAGYPSVYGTSLSIGTGPYGGFYMSSYPY